MKRKCRKWRLIERGGRFEDVKEMLEDRMREGVRRMYLGGCMGEWECMDWEECEWVGG